MRVLLIGSGGREHALARALVRDPAVTDLHVAPGNAGTAQIATAHAVNPVDIAAVTALAERLAPGLVVIGPEAPLVAGAADALRESGITCFGPGAAAARIEGSKAFAKDVMAAAGIPTAAALVCETAAEVAAALDRFGPPHVVKDDALAAGKGVLVTTDRDAALAHAQACGRVVVEEFLDGPELSLFALCDGTAAVPLLPAQDFKRAYDGDQGPNTGGMGAYAPLPWAPPGLAAEVTDTVIRPAVAELRRRGTPYQGLLYAGLCLTAQGVRVVEFNARFGDPETQVIVDRLTTPLAGLLHAAATGALSGAPSPQWAPGAAVTVVLAAEGYPGSPVTGDVIEGLDDTEEYFLTHPAISEVASGRHGSELKKYSRLTLRDTTRESAEEQGGPRAAEQGPSRAAEQGPSQAADRGPSRLADRGASHVSAGSERSPAPGAPVPSQAYILHAGTSRDAAGRVVSAGGRVLNAVGTGPDLAAARLAAYLAVRLIRMRGGWCRSDIAERAAADSPNVAR